MIKRAVAMSAQICRNPASSRDSPIGRHRVGNVASRARQYSTLVKLLRSGAATCVVADEICCPEGLIRRWIVQVCTAERHTDLPSCDSGTSKSTSTYVRKRNNL